MSFDTHLREAFGEETWEVETGAALRQVHERAHRSRVRQGAAATMVAGVALLAGVGVVLGQSRSATDQPVGPVGSATASPTPGHPTAAGPLDGTWALGPVTAAQIRSTLREAGQEAWIRTVVRDLPQPPLRYRLTISKGRADLVLTGADGERVPTDQEYLTTKGDQAVLEPLGAIGVNRFQWALDGDTLRLRLVSSSEAMETIAPNGAFLRALYEVGDWTRVGTR
jgi:hypothetical protein